MKEHDAAGRGLLQDRATSTCALTPPRLVFPLTIRGLHHQVRSGLRPLADSEERRLRAVPPQDLQQPCGVHSRVGPSSIVSAMSLADGSVRNVAVAAYAAAPPARRPRGRSLLRQNLPGREPGPGPSRATGGEQADPGEEPAAIHTSHPA